MSTRRGGRPLFIRGKAQNTSCTRECGINCAKCNYNFISVTPCKASLTLLNYLIFKVFISSNAHSFVAWSYDLVGEYVGSLLASPIKEFFFFNISNGEGCSLTLSLDLDTPNQGLFNPKFGPPMYLFCKKQKY